MAGENNPKKILILRFSSMGDIIMATPMLRVVRKKYPGAEITMVVRDDFRELISDCPHIDRKIYLNRNSGLSGLFQLADELKKNNFDLVIDAHKSLRSLYIDFALRKIPHVCIDKRTAGRLLLIYTKFVNLLKNPSYQMDEYIFPLKKYDIENDNRGPELFINEKIRKEAVEELNHWRKGSTLPLIGLVPSANWPGKRWPIEKWVELAGKISGSGKAQAVVIGGKNDNFCIEIAAFPGIFDFHGHGGIQFSAALLEQCKFVISNDTGMMHAAEAVGRDVIGIMGPTSIEFGCYPWRKTSCVIEKKMWCRPCSKNGQGVCIRFGKRPCLNDITVGEVFQKTVEYLSG